MTNSSKLKVGDQLVLTIEKLTFGGGRGLARHQKFVIFVSHVISGERILAEVTLIKKNFAEAKLIKVMAPSKHRIVPTCNLVASCGGCCWQHLSYNEQLLVKDKLLKENMRNFKNITFLDFIPSPQPFNYRNRIQVHKKGSSIGYFQRRSHKLVAFESCAIADHKINSNFARILKGQPNGRFEIALTTEGELTQTIKKTSKDQIFSQVNESQNQNIKLNLDKWLKNINFKNALELFCGNGNFTEELLKNINEEDLYAVDGSSKLINEASLKFKKANFICSKIDGSINNLFSKNNFDLILLDPPRKGCSSEALTSILTLEPKNIIYISCNPTTLSRDLMQLEKSNYKPIQIQGYDMFPQTDHIESMTLVSRL